MNVQLEHASFSFRDGDTANPTQEQVLAQAAISQAISLRRIANIMERNDQVLHSNRVRTLVGTAMPVLLKLLDTAGKDLGVES